MSIYIVGKGYNAILEPTNEQLSKKCDWSGWMDGYPLDCYDYKSTCRAKNGKFSPILAYLWTRE